MELGSVGGNPPPRSSLWIRRDGKRNDSLAGVFRITLSFFFPSFLYYAADVVCYGHFCFHLQWICVSTTQFWSVVVLIKLPTWITDERNDIQEQGSSDSNNINRTYQFKENNTLTPTSTLYSEERNPLPIVSFHLVEALFRLTLPFHAVSLSLFRSIVSIVFAHVRLLGCVFWHDAHPVFGSEEENPKPELDGGSYVTQFWLAF